MIFSQPTGPIIVRVFEEPAKETTVVDVLVGSLGLTAVLLLIAALAGLALGALFVWWKKRNADSLEITAQTLELSPTAEKR